MAYIARTDGATSGEPIEVRSGVLTDISETDRANWRSVSEQPVTILDSQIKGAPSFSIQGDGGVHLIWQVVDLPGPYAKMTLRDWAANERWVRTQSGILFDGVKIHTSDASQAKIHAAITVLDKQWLPSLRWKTADGWMTVDADAMNLIGSAVAQYVQDCYDAEEAIAAEIDAGTIASVSEIRSHQSWPSNEYTSA